MTLQQKLLTFSWILFALAASMELDRIRETFDRIHRTQLQQLNVQAEQAKTYRERTDPGAPWNRGGSWMGQEFLPCSGAIRP